MTIATYIFTVAAAIITLVVVVEMLRRRRLRERHALWWTIAGALALVVSVFPSSLMWVAGLIGVEVPLNLVFFVSLAVLFLVNVQQNVELTTLEAKARTLAESTTLLALRVEQLEGDRSGATPRPGYVDGDAEGRRDEKGDHRAGHDLAGDQE